MEFPGGGGSTVRPSGTENPGGWGGQTGKTLRGGVWIFSGTTQCLACENRKSAHKNSQKNFKNLKPSMNNVVSTGKNFAKTAFYVPYWVC